MSLWRQLVRGLRVLANRKSADQDVSDEVQHYLDEAAASLEAEGLSSAQARRVARLQFGNTTVVREQIRSSGWENAISATLSDLRYSARQLGRNPGFAAVTVLTLALGIGACTAIFSAVNPILFEPLPYPHADRILMMSDFGVDSAPIDVTFGTYRELAARIRSFDALAAADAWQPVTTGTAQPERLDGQRVTFGYFRVLSVFPAVGRDFEESDGLLNAPKVAILSDGLVQRRFGGDHSIVGRQITVNGDPYTVIGVMPRGFENALTPSAEIWAPVRYRWPASFQGPEWGHHMRMVGRLKPGVTADQARSEIAAITHTPMGEFSRPAWADLSQGLMAHRLKNDLTRGVRPALLAVLGAVLLVLIIACVNVTNLLLARGAQRRSEFAMRAALGAGSSRLIRQILTESLLMALISGTLGMLIAEWGVRALVALSPPELPRVNAIALNGPVFAFALGITMLVGLLVGMIPALHVSRGDPQSGLQQSTRGTVASGHYLTRRTLVVTEVGLALVLLVSAGLLLRSLQRLFAVAPGFEAPHLLTMQLDAAGHRYDADIATHKYFDQVLEAVRRVPGVISAAFTSQLPLSEDFDKYGYEFQSIPNSDNPGEDGSAFRYMVTPDYFQTMHIPLRRGRLLDAHDVLGASEAILVSEFFAKHKFAGQDPIGQRIRFGPEIGQKDRPWDVVVGVVGDVKQASLALAQSDAFYVAMG